MLGLVLAVQLRLNRYVPIVYRLTVVVLSVAGTLYTDILTDSLAVPLALSTTVFAVLLAIVFGIWYARERTLSIHSIVTTPRELFYWLAVLVTFALGTAVGDWTIVLTGLGPRHIGSPARRPDPRHCRRLAIRCQRSAVLLVGLHPHPPVGCEPR